VVSANEAPAVKAVSPPAPVRDALGKGNYPWYDAKADAVKPLWPPREPDLGWLDRWLGHLHWLPTAGQLVSITVAMVALGIFLIVLLRLWRYYQPAAAASGAAGLGSSRTGEIEGLPAGLRPETDDPWSEAVRCRARGDYARAVVCLFAHQLLTLDRLRQIRLVPGRTGRQLVRATADRQLRDWVESTLRLFEAVYYGHRDLTAEAFEPVWSAAEAFERRVAEGVVR
jgi:hypothetical protein